MTLPPVLYKPTAYDFRTGIAPRRYLESATINFTATTNDINFTPVPANKILVLQRICLSLAPTAVLTESITQVNVVIQSDESGATSTRGFVVQRENGPSGFPAEYFHDSEPGIILMPGEYISSAVVKSGAINNYRHIFTAWGLILPRANIQSG